MGPQIAGPHPSGEDSGPGERDLRVCIAKDFSCEVHAAGLATALGEPRV